MGGWVGVDSLITDRKHSKYLNTFRSVINIAIMSSSSNDELPDIPGTRFPWMEDDQSSSTSRSPRKKRGRISAVEKEKNVYKNPKKKSVATRMELSSDDDDFVNPKPGSSKKTKPKQPITEEDPRKKQLREAAARYRAKKKATQSAVRNETPEEHQQRNKANAKRTAAARANETQEEHQRRKQAAAVRTAAARANETPEEHLDRNRANAERTAAARANETPAEHQRRNQTNAERTAAA